MTDTRIRGPIGDAYARYDADPRSNGLDGFEAFADALEALLESDSTLGDALGGYAIEHIWQVNDGTGDYICRLHTRDANGFVCKGRGPDVEGAINAALTLAREDSLWGVYESACESCGCKMVIVATIHSVDNGYAEAFQQDRMKCSACKAMSEDELP